MVPIALLGLSLLSVALAAPLVREETFANIKNVQSDQFVVFYRSSDANSVDILSNVKKAAKKLKTEMPDFKFYKCDGDRAANAADFKEAGFNSGTYLFSQISPEGIVKYTLDSDAKTLYRYIKTKYALADEDDVKEFTDEDTFWDLMDGNERPVFVKFYEKWCAHCQRLKKTYTQAATFFKNRVDFVEVECSKNADSTAFCTKHEVKGYPVLMLFTGEKKIKFEEENRNIISFERFFEKHAFLSLSSAQAGAVDENVRDEPVKPANKGPILPKKRAAVAEEPEEDVLNVGKFAKPAGSSALEARVAALEAKLIQLEKKIQKLE